MKEITRFIRQFAKEIHKGWLLATTLFTAALVFLNYHDKLEYRLVTHESLPFSAFTGHFLIYFLAFSFPYLLYYLFTKRRPNSPAILAIAIVAAPLIFALKVWLPTDMGICWDPAWNQYWNDIIYWPARMLIVVIILWAFKLVFHKNEKLYGLSGKKNTYSPYLIMLLIMLPLIGLASTQPDFLAVYPKLQRILPLPAGAHPSWLYQLFFELSYGSDFFTIEIFFRGFLVIGFMKWAGKAAILPMACFYCSIHFGKPLGECISSYFGGILLGIVSYHTRSIYGGLMVHLGIAWMMEAGGYIGNLLKW